jgi:hypothetical protein
MRTKPWASGARPRTIGVLLSLVLMSAAPAIAIAQSPDPAPPPPPTPQPDAPPDSGPPPVTQSPPPAVQSPPPAVQSPPPIPSPAPQGAAPPAAMPSPLAPPRVGNAATGAQREARRRATAERRAAAKRRAAAAHRAAAKRVLLAELRAAATARSYRSAVEESSVLGLAPPGGSPQAAGTQPEPVDHDALLIGGALALLAVAASSTLLVAQVARLQRELGAG